MPVDSADASVSEQSASDSRECPEDIDTLVRERDYLAKELRHTRAELAFYKERCQRLQRALDSRDVAMSKKGWRWSGDGDQSLQQTKEFIASVMSKGRRQYSQYAISDQSLLYSSYSADSGSESDDKLDPRAGSKITVPGSKDPAGGTASRAEVSDLAYRSGIGLSRSKETVAGFRVPDALYDDHLETAYDTIAVLLNTVHALQPTAQQFERLTSAFVRRGIMPVFLDSSKTTLSLKLEVQGTNFVHIFPRYAEGSFIPQQAYCLMAQFIARYGIPREEANELLIALCALMKRADDEYCAMLTERLRTEIITLRRRLSMAVPYDKVHADKQISRLKNDLRHFRTLYLQEIDRKSRPVHVDFRTSSDSALLQAMNSRIQELTATLASTYSIGGPASNPEANPAETIKAPPSRSRSRSRSTEPPREHSSRPATEPPPVGVTSVEVARAMTHEFEILAKRIRTLLDRLLADAQHCEDLAISYRLLERFAANVEDLLIAWSASSRQVLSAILQLTHDTFTWS